MRGNNFYFYFVIIDRTFLMLETLTVESFISYHCPFEAWRGGGGERKIYILKVNYVEGLIILNL